MPGPTPSAPPLAGLCSYDAATMPGVAVAEAVNRVRRLVFLKSRSLFLFAAHFNGLPEWEVKGAISLHLWQDAEHSTWFRNRICEMRTPPHHLDRVPDPALETFMQELGAAGDSVEFLPGVYQVFKPSVAAALRDIWLRPIRSPITRRVA